MIKAGRFNPLVVVATGADGVLLEDASSQRVRMPPGQTDSVCRPGDQLEVFVYVESDGSLAGTTRQPLVQLGQVALLEVVEVNAIGAFADWGLPRDLFIPFAEQQHPLRKGQRVLVIVYLDNQGRIAGSTRIDHRIGDDATGLRAGDRVSLVVADRTDLGFKAIINHHCWGLLYGNELFRTLRKGQVTEGYVKQVRADNKVDLTLSKPGFSRGKIDELSERILRHMEAGGGRMSLTDKSPPREIYSAFGVSKKVFKQSLGALYKKRLIRFEAGGTSLVEQ